MIVRSIRVAGWRCFVEPIEIGPLGDGMNVIHGPNGIGKSSLFMALGRGLLDDHASAAEGIKQLRPWGRELAPQVTIEFEHDGAAYRVHKQFLDSRRAEFARLDAGRYLPLAESKSADEQVRKLLQGEAFSKRKGPDPQGWGLAQVLWASQGEIALGELAGSARQSLQEALGSQVAGSQTLALEASVAALYGSSFTAGGKYKSGAAAPKVVDLEQQLAAARARTQQQLTRLSAFDDASRRIEDLQNQAKISGRELEELETRRANLRTLVEAYLKLLNSKETGRQAAEAAKARFEQCQTKVDAVQGARQELKQWDDELQRLEIELPVVSKEIGLHSAEAAQANQAVEAVKLRRSSITAARQLAALADTFVQTTLRFEQTKRLVSLVEATQEEVNGLQKQHRELGAPDAKQLATILRTARARDDLRLKLDASLITLQLTPESQLSVEVILGESPGHRELAQGQTISFPGAPEVVLRIAGVGSVRATGPTGSAEQLRSQWQLESDRLTELTLGYGTQDLEELKLRSTTADQLCQELAKCNTRMETLLAGRQLEDLKHGVANGVREITTILDIQPSWTDSPPIPATLLREVDDIERKFTDDIDAAESRQNAAVEAVRLAGLKIATYEADQKNAQKQFAAAKEHFKKVTGDGLTDEQRESRLTEEAMAWRAAKAQLATAEQQLADFGNDPRDDAAGLERQVQALRDAATETTKRLHIEEGKLQSILAEAPYSALAAEEEIVARLMDEIADEKLRLDAIRLLHESLMRRKREIVESLVGPVCQRAQQTLSRIAGARFERLAISESFQLEGVVPRAASQAVPLDQLSGGEREQTHFAVRLALADIAFSGQRQLVVLDDVFTFTDTARLARIVAILEEAAERFQIVLLTCHPERYRGLPKAQFFDLESIVSRKEFDGLSYTA